MRGPVTLHRLAEALRTTPAALLGVGSGPPPGRSGPARRPQLETLEPAEWRRLLAPGGVGRVAFPANPGAEVLPVNYAVVHGDIVFRTASGSVLAANVERMAPRAGFEVDHADQALGQGWSVLVIG
jgi:nitroimidazol reductase NimA-like FMN-containing flavoprotein (pyridoxamine 5'-phosphate oxidase superfamily)